MSGRRFTSEEMGEIKRRHRAGESVYAIAEALGASPPGVRNAIRRLGFETPVAVVITGEQEARIVELCREGDATFEEIAEEVGLSITSVSRISRKHGIQMRKGPARKFTPEEQTEIWRRYEAGESTHSIARALGCGAMTIHRTIKRLGKEARDWPNPVVTEEQREKAIRECAEGATAREAANAVGISKETVFKELGKRGVSLPQGRPRSCFVDDGAFDVITPESAYFFGFLFSDGCVHQDQYGAPVLAVGLAERDRAQLEKLRFFLRSTHAITWADKSETSFGGPFVYFRVRSRRICAALNRRGLVTKRSRTPVAELAGLSDFHRGMIDGDGWLGTTKMRGDGDLAPYIGLSGQIPILEAFRTFVGDLGCEPPPITPTESGIWKVQMYEKDAAEVVRTLYGGASVALDRKNERAQAIIAGDWRRFPPYAEGPSRIASDLPDLRNTAGADIRAVRRRAREPIPRLRTPSFEIEPVSASVVEDLCAKYHAYGSAGSITTYAFAVVEDGLPVAVYAWQPPALGAAQAVCPEVPGAVLALSRMVAVPQGERRLRHISKPLRYQMRNLIDRTRWPVLVTYSDEGVGHTGHVYKCSGWQPTERAERVFYVDAEGRRASIPTSDIRDRGLRVGGRTVLQRWEHRVCAPDDVAEWLHRHGWRRVEIPGRVWRSGNPAFRWVRDGRSI